MLRRIIIKTGIVASFGALTLAGCSSSSAPRNSAATNAQLAGRTATMPVSSQARGGASARRGTTRLPPPNVAEEAGRGGGLEIDSGVPTTAEHVAGPTMPDGVAGTLLESATVLELRGNLEAARQQFERALQAAPHDMKVLVGFARFADRHGQGSVAAEMYQRVLEENEANPLLWSEAGLSLCRNGRGEAGLAACRKALGAAPDNARCQANLTEALAAAREFQDGGARLAQATPAPTASPSMSPDALGAARITADSRGGESPSIGTPALNISQSTEPTPARDATSSAPPVFSPGSTARQYERRLPPVKASRRETAPAPSAEPTPSNVNSPEQFPVAPPDRSRFIPPAVSGAEG